MDIYPTPKQEEIIKYIYRFRFLDRTHIQRLLHHKEPRRINKWLKELTEADFLGRIYLNKIPDNTKPARYYLAGKGMDYMYHYNQITKQQLKKYYGDKNRSLRFIDRCLFLADLFLILTQEAETNNKMLHFFTKADLANHDYFPNPSPDVYFELKGKTKTRRYFLEAFVEGMPRFALKARLKQYLDYVQEEEWQLFTKDDIFPFVLWVCPTLEMKKFLHRYIPKIMAEEIVEINFRLSTRQQIKDQEQGTGAWEKVVLE